MRKISIFLVVLLCVACTKNTDEALNESELISNFEAHQESYSKMKDMIILDVRSQSYFKVGLDRIGEYSLDETGWYKNYNEYVPYDIVLGIYLLSHERVEEYLRLLKITGAEEVEYYNGNVAITVLANGFLFGGCLSQIYYQPNKVVLDRSSWANVYHSAVFSENWAGETECN